MAGVRHIDSAPGWVNRELRALRRELAELRAAGLGRRDPWHIVGAVDEPPFAAGVSQNAGWRLRFRKDGLGAVHVRGIAVLTAAPTATPTPLFTLPEGYWPSSDTGVRTLVMGSAANTSARADVAVDGVVSLLSHVGTATTYHLDLIPFSTF